MSTLALVWDLIAIDNASGTMRKVGAEAETAGGMVGKLATSLGAAGLGLALGYSVKQAADFQAQMVTIKNLTGAAGASVGGMSQQLLDMAGKVAQSPEALATSLYHMASIGLQGADALNAVEIAAKGAAIGHADLEETTNSLTSTIASGIAKNMSYSDTMSKLLAIVGTGDMSLSQLNDALSNGLFQTMAAYNVNLDQVGAALAAFGDGNIRGANAATALRMATQSFFKTAQGGDEILQKYGLSADKLKQDMEQGGLTQALDDLHQHLIDSGVTANQFGDIVTEVFGKKAGVGLAVLLQEFDRYHQKLDEMSSATNTLDEKWQNVTKTAQFQFKQLEDQLQAAAVKLGTVLLPALGGFSAWIATHGIPDLEGFAKKVADAFHSDAVQKILGELKIGWDGLTATLGDFGNIAKTVFKDVVLPVLGVALTLVGGLAKAFGSLPGPIRDVVAAFVALKVLTSTNLFAGILGDAATADKAATGIRGMTASMVTFGTSTVSAMKAAGAATVGFADTLAASFTRAKAATEAMMMSTIGVAPGVVTGLSGIRAAAGTAATMGMDTLRAAGNKVVDFLGGRFMTALTAVTVAWAVYDSAIQHNRDSIKQWGDALLQGGAAAQQASKEMANPSFWDKFSYNVTHWFNTQQVSVGLMQQASDAADQQYAKLDTLGRAQLAVTQATSNYNDVLNQYPPNSAQAKAAADELAGAQQHLTTTQDMLNEATKTHLQQMKDIADAQRAAISDQFAAQQSIDDFNSAVLIGTTSQRDLGNMLLRAADDAGRLAADQAKANGVTDTSVEYNAAYLKVLKDNEKQLNGPTKDAIDQHIGQMDKVTVSNGNLQDALDKMHLSYRNTWDDNVKIIDDATPQMEQQLRDLGLHVEELPGMPGHPAEIIVTANTDQATQTIADFMRTVQAEGFLNAIYGGKVYFGPDLNAGNRPAPSSGGPVGFPPVPRAGGGPVYGPGTGTSDSILALLSNGEYVVKATQAAKHMPLLHAINNGLPGFADGGLVYPLDLGPMWTDPMMAFLNAMRSGPAPSSANAALGKQMAAQFYGWVGAEWTALNEVAMQESGWNNTAQNPTSTAYGIGQFLDDTWATVGLSKTSDPNTQIAGMLKYIAQRYGDPIGAWQHEVDFGWYDGGGYLMPGATLALNGTGRPERIRTADQEAALQGDQQIVLQLDGPATTALLNGQIVSFAKAQAARGRYSS